MCVQLQARQQARIGLITIARILFSKLEGTSMRSKGWCDCVLQREVHGCANIKCGMSSTVPISCYAEWTLSIS